MEDMMAEADRALPTSPRVASLPSDTDLTGVAAADAALARLRDVESAPLEEHVEIFDDVHQRLHEGLSELDNEQ